MSEELMTAIPNLALALPELWLAGGAMVLLMVGVYSGSRASQWVTGLSIALLIIATVTLVWLTGDYSSQAEADTKAAITTMQSAFDGLPSAAFLAASEAVVPAPLPAAPGLLIRRTPNSRIRCNSALWASDTTPFLPGTSPRNLW